VSFSKLSLIVFAAAMLSAGCASNPISSSEPRFPAGTGDVESSVPENMKFSLESYKLPIVRESKTETRMAHNFWSGEWPAPVIDVQSSKKSGTTTISGFSSLRNPGPERLRCTVKNGVYHPWSQKDPSIINYYTLAELLDYKVINKVVRGNGDQKSKAKTIYPKGAEILNVVYYGENFCGATLKIGKNLRPVTDDCPFFMENPSFQRTSPATNLEREFREQWLYFACEEKGADGKQIKAFVQDADLLGQPGIQKGCLGEYGSVGGTTSTGACR